MKILKITILSLILFPLFSQAKSVKDCMVSNPNQKLTLASVNAGIFSYRIYALGGKKVRKNSRMRNINKRTNILAQTLLELKENPDVLFLQEIWSTSAKILLKKRLKKRYPYFVHIPYSFYEGLTGQQKAGLMIFSKYKILKKDLYYFSKKALGTDKNSKLGRKGILAARIVKNGTEINLFNTHLANSGSHHDIQLKEAGKFFEKFNNDGIERATIFGGDFNISSKSKLYKDISSKILPKLKDTYLKKCSKTHRSNRGKRGNRIDYLFTSKNLKSFSYILDPAGEKIHDHFLILGEFDLNNY